MTTEELIYDLTLAFLNFSQVVLLAYLAVVADRAKIAAEGVRARLEEKEQ